MDGETLTNRSGCYRFVFSLKHPLYYYHIDRKQTAVECFDISRIEKNYFLSLFVIMLYYYVLLL